MQAKRLTLASCLIAAALAGTTALAAMGKPAFAAEPRITTAGGPASAQWRTTFATASTAEAKFPDEGPNGFVSEKSQTMGRAWRE